MAYFRKVSPAEYVMLADSKPDYVPHINTFFVEGEGQLNLSDWKAAVEKVAHANPGCRLKLKRKGLMHYWDDEGEFPKVEKVDSDWDGTSSVNAWFMGKPIDPRTDPTCEVILLNGTKPRILVRTHHAVTDGIGTFHFIEEIFRALRGEPLMPALDTRDAWDIAMAEPRPEKFKPLVGGCPPLVPQAIEPNKLRGRWVKLSYPCSRSKMVEKMALAVANLARQTHSADSRVVVRLLTLSLIHI